MNFLGDLTKLTKKNYIQTLRHLPDFQIVKCVEFLRYYTQRLILKHYIINTDFSIIIYFLFYRHIAPLITLVILLLVVFIVMKKRGILKRLKEKFGGSRRTQSGSYNTNKSIIQIVIPTQERSSWGT